MTRSLSPRAALHHLSAVGLLLALFLMARHDASAQSFMPDLGQGLELIDGGGNLVYDIPADAPELVTYPMPQEFPRELLSELPRRPFRQVDPMPEARAWWKYPFYAALGFPRDVVDGFVGVLANVPFLGIIVYPAYEIVPTQAFLRDPRDWHRWDGNQNRNGHGFYDGNSWGWFPSLNQWKFSYPSEKKLAKNRAYNQELQTELNARNREIEAANQLIANRQREARRLALEAIDAGNGREATLRILPAHQAYPGDEGIFALYVTALALHPDPAPAWLHPTLYNKMNTAQPRMLDQAEKLLDATAKKQPDHAGLQEALIYARLLLAREQSALDTAQAWHARSPGDARRARLVFETALSAENAAAARGVLPSLAASTADATERQLMEDRVALLEGRVEPARAQLAALQQAQPENAYYNYYLGAANLIDGIGLGEPTEDVTELGKEFDDAFTFIEKAALQAPNTALRLRASQALGYVRGVVAGLAGNPELASPSANPLIP